MTSFTDLYGQAWRDYVVDGVPASGVYEPEKATIRALGQALDTSFDDLRQILALGGVTIYKTTRALLYADLAHVADTIAAVTMDSTAAYNGIYVKSGASGSGSWSQIFEFLDSASVLATLTAYVDGEISDVQTEIDALDARVDATEADITALQTSSVPAETAARAADGVDVIGGVFRDFMATAQASTAINTSGAAVSGGANRATGFIEVTANSRIIRFGTNITSGTYVPYAFYDSSKTFLGYAWTGTGDYTTLDISTGAPAGTKYVRLTGGSNVKAYIYDRQAVDLMRHMLFSLYGLPIDAAGQLTNQYVNKSTGVVSNSSSYRLTAAIAVTPESWLATTAGLISPLDSARAQYAFFDDTSTYLGSYSPVAVGQAIKVGDHFPTAATVRVTMTSTETGAVHVLVSAEHLDRVMTMLAAGAILDYFALDTVTVERLTLTGGTTQKGVEPWRTTDYIEVVEGQVFFLAAQDVTALGAVIAGYDSDGLFVGNLVTGTTGQDFLWHQVTIPAGIDKIRGTYRSDTAPFFLYSVRPAAVSQSGSDTFNGVSALPPDAAYGRAGEPFWIFARGVVGDRAVPVTFVPQTGDFSAFQGAEKVRIVKADTSAATIKCRAVVGQGRVDISEFAAYVSASPTSPASHINIVCIGDSTTSQLSSGDPESIDGDGTWVNELARQLTGTGDAALSVGASEWGDIVAGDIRAPLSLTNIHFRGTRGTGTIKHEGRGGWRPLSYLERTDTVGGDGKFNAFWDASLTPWGPVGTDWRFSMKYYIENNSWDIGSTTQGVTATGDNLLVIIALGWNDYGGNIDAGVSATHMAYLIDQIHAEYPNAMVWVLSLWAPPETILKQANASYRWYSSAEAFDLATRAFGTSYRNVCAPRANTMFLQVSHQMDPDFCFSRGSIAPNRTATDTSLALYGAGDFVHMRRRGYAMLADVVADAFLYHYCQ